MSDHTVCLQVSQLRLGFRRSRHIIPVVDGVTFSLHRGEMTALLGESGCGKSLTALALMGLLPRPDAVITGGCARYADGTDLLQLNEEEWRAFRGRRIAMIFQEPMTSLNPVMTVGTQLSEAFTAHAGSTIAPRLLRQRCVTALEEVEIPEAATRLNAYPHELSGGLRQRVMIAMALAADPEVLIADEPTTALDVTVQAQIMALIDRLRQQRNMSVLFITHNLPVAAQYAQHCAVMYAGQIVESADSTTLFAEPHHPYTALLQQARPDQARRGVPIATVPGMVPANWQTLHGCRFAPRCPWAEAQCHTAAPPLLPVPAKDAADAAGTVRCHRPLKPSTAKETADTPQISSPEPHSSGAREVLRVENLRVWYPLPRRIFTRTPQFIKAVDNVSFTLHEGETLAIVGESGCGKSTVARAILQLLPVPLRSGSIMLSGQPVAKDDAASLRLLRRSVRMIFQDAASSLDPRMMAGESIAEGLEGLRLTAGQRETRISELLLQCGLTPDDRWRYPHQFSGGQRQRIALARALASSPQLIICDECTSALDVSVQAQILNLLKRIQKETRVACLFITHDLNVVRYLADRMAVMYLGHTVEEGEAELLLSRPAHPYTRALAASSRGAKFTATTGMADGGPPSPIHPPSGCPYHPRCPYALPCCSCQLPPRRELSGERSVSCFITGPLPPAV